MENKIIIGNKMTKKDVLKNYLLLTFFGLFGVMGFLGVVSPYLDIDQSVKYLISICIFSSILLLLTPIIGSSEILEISDKNVCYYHVDGYFNQFMEVYRILTNGNEVADTCMKTTDIYKINLSYISNLHAWGQKGYHLKLTFLLRDGSTFSIFPCSIGQMENGDYELAFQLLERNNIVIVDRNNLRKSLSQSALEFHKYISKLEEDK